MARFQRVLVTGGTGFLGSHVVDELRARGYSDIVVPKRVDFDLTQQQHVRRLLDVAESDLVIHLAARVGGIGANQANPALYFYVNSMMGIMLMEEARLRQVRKFVCIGTICSYPKFAPVPFREEDLWCGYPEETNAPYGLAKKMHLVQAQAYRQQYGFNAIYLMPVNLYGPGDNFDPDTSHVIPALIRKFAEAAEHKAPSVTLWGDGSPTREFLYVGDAARAIVAAAETYDQAEPVNLGSGEEISIKSLAEKIALMLGYRGEICWDTTKPNGQPRRRLDVSRAKQSFGFEASTPLDTGLRQTIEWHFAGDQIPNHLRAKRTDSTVKPSSVVSLPARAGAISIP